jgi:hypothetical protein
MRILLVNLAVLLLPAAAAAAPVCGDCNHDGHLTILDALRAARIDVGLITGSFPDDTSCDANSSGQVDAVDATLLARVAVELPEPTECVTVRAVHQLGTTAPPPTRTAPDWYDPEGDVVGLNEGEFTEDVTLGAGGNPVVLFEVGETFPVVLEATLHNPTRVVDVSAAVNPEGTTTWTPLGPGVSVSGDGVVTGLEPNQCTTVLAVFTPTVGLPAATRFAACVDLWGVDTVTRLAWLPPGQVDCGLVGLPSGPPVPPPGSPLVQHYYANPGPLGIAGIHLNLEWDQALLSDSTAFCPGPGCWGSIDDHAPGRSHHAVSCYYVGLEVISILSLEWTVLAPGPLAINARVESAGDGAGDPYDTYPLGAPAASHDPTAPVNPLGGPITLAGVTSPPAPLCGDVDGSGSVDIIDTLVVTQTLMGLYTLTTQEEAAANVAGICHPDPAAVLDIVDMSILMAFVSSRIPAVTCCP